MTLSPVKVLLIIVLIVLLFGAGRIPKVMEGLAQGIKGFKKGLKDEDPAVKAVEHKDEKNNS